MDKIEEKINALSNYRNAISKEDQMLFDNLISYAKEMHAEVEQKKRMSMIANF